MKRRWIAKLSRAICPALVGALVLTAWASVQAAPLVNIALQGKLPGEPTSEWRSTITEVEVGDVIEYRIVFNMAPVGTSNTQDTATGPNTLTVNSLTSADGMNSLYLALRQSAAEPIQVNFTRGAVVFDPDLGEDIDTQTQLLVGPWRAGTGARGGNLAPRAGTNPWMNLEDIRPVRASGSFQGGSGMGIVSTAPPDLPLVGRMTVGAIDGGLEGHVWPAWGGATSGGGRINGGTNEFFVTEDTLAGNDPIVGFTPLTLQAVPEPSTIALVAMGLVGVVAFARRRRLA